MFGLRDPRINKQRLAFSVHLVRLPSTWPRIRKWYTIASQELFTSMTKLRFASRRH